MSATRIKRSDLLATLESVRPGLSVSDTLEQSSCIVFSNGWAFTFNGEVAARTKTGLPPEFEGAVKADPLFRVLTTFPDDEVEVRMTDAEVQIRGTSKGDRRKAGIRFEPEVVLPIEEVETPGGWRKLPPDFGEAVAKVRNTVGKNKEQFLTLCIHVHPEWLESCDRYQVTRYNIATGVDAAFLVREKALQHVVSTGMTRISETPNWVHFRTGGSLIYSFRRYVETYPDMAPMLEFRGTPTVLPRGAESAATLAAVFSSEDKDNNKVLVTLSDGTMTVRGDASFGWAEEELRVTYDGPATEFRINPDLLIQIVKEHKNGEIGPGRLRVSGEKWVYVTQLAKAKKEKKDERERKPAAEPGDAPEPGTARRGKPRPAAAEPEPAGRGRDRDAEVPF